MASTAPEELLMKIFLLQPLKTLGQLCCVCKSWNQIISSKYFIKTHADHQQSSSNTNQYVLIDHWSCAVSRKVYIGSSNVPDSHIYEADEIFGRDWDLKFNCLEIYGICDGLLCLSEDSNNWQHSNHRIFLWNPFLKKGKKLPPLASNYQVEHRGPPCLCFGHDGDDYKVININPLRNEYHVYIYSLSTNSWKFLKFVNTNDSYKFNVTMYPKVTLVNGVAYFVQWSCSDRRDGRIVSFDIKCETIRYIDLPKDIDYNINYIMKEYGELIALVICDENTFMVMWVLRMSDNSFSWDKKFTMEAQGKLLMGSITKEELVMWNYDEKVKKCFLYNVENGFERRFPTLDLEPNTISGHFLQRISYLTESLVLKGESTTNSIRRNVENGDESRVPCKQKLFLIFEMKNLNVESFANPNDMYI